MTLTPAGFPCRPVSGSSRLAVAPSGVVPLAATTAAPDPRAVYQWLRGEWGAVAPVELEPGVSAWLVLGWAEVCYVARQERLFSRDPRNWRAWQEQSVAPDSGLGPMMFPRDNAYFRDGFEHHRLRAPLDEGIGQVDQRRLRRQVEQICADLIGGFTAAGRADLMADYAAVIPMLAVSSLFGLDTEQGHALRAALAALFGSGTDAQDGSRMVEQIIGGVIAARKQQPGSDMASVFLRHPNLHGDGEVAQSMVLMISAGYETTATWIAQTLRLMLTDPRFGGQIRGGRLGVDDALDEVLWRDPPMANMPARYALADTQVGGQAIQRGDALVLGLAAAGSDPAVCTDDEWLLFGNRAHLAWSAGPHACPAPDLARIITRTAVSAVLARLPGVRLAITPDQVRVQPSPWTRCPAALPVAFPPPPAPASEQEVPPKTADARPPVVRLDPSGADHHGEAALLRDLGPVVRVLLPGEIPAWAIPWHEPLAALVRDRRVSKNYRTWNAWKTGRIPPDWPLTGMLAVDNMVTADGAAHQRLRRLVTGALSPSRIQALRPRITQITGQLLDELPGHAGPDGSIDLRQHFAYPVPMHVISELMGVPDQWRPRLRELVDSIFRTDTTPQEAAATEAGRIQLLAELIALRTAEPGQDLTSALITARRDQPGTLTGTELADTIWVMVTAGHETTLSLITNTARALLTHPWQRRYATTGDDRTWAAVIEEVLRWDAPIGNFMARYPTQDITIAGTTIPAGDAILAPYTAAGRDPAWHGPDAHLLDITRRQKGHLAFGAGPHACPGAPLARIEAAIALPALFTRYPRLTLAIPPAQLRPVPSLFSNSARSLPVRLSPPGPAQTIRRALTALTRLPATARTPDTQS